MIRADQAAEVKPRRWRLLPRLGLLAVLGFGALKLAVPVLGTSGEVHDAETRTPLAGAVARAGDASAESGPSGVFRLGGVLPWQAISIEAEGYESRSAPGWLLAGAEVALRPLVAEVRVVNDETGELIPARLQSDFGRIDGLEPGRFRLTAIKPGSRVVVDADGFELGSAQYTGETSLELRLAPLRVGRIVNAASGQPIANALILSDERFVTSDADGGFELPGRPRRPLRVTAPGFRRLEVDTRALRSLDLHLEPFTVRGLYLTFFGVADEALRANVLRLLETTEVNAVVVDIKGDRGYLAYESRVPLAGQIGAN